MIYYGIYYDAIKKKHHTIIRQRGVKILVFLHIFEKQKNDISRSERTTLVRCTYKYKCV